MAGKVTPFFGDSRPLPTATVREAPDAKTCRGCNTEKPLDQFNISKLGAQGRYARCKTCKRAADRARRPRVTKPVRPAPSNPLLAQIDTLVSADSRDMVALSRACNLSPNTFLAWRRASKRGPSVFPLMRLLDTLGYELVIHKRGESGR